jgi:hypothetical protein
MHADRDDVPQKYSADLLYASLGARAGAELHVFGPVSARATVDVVFPLNHVTLELAHQTVWKTPTVAARGGVVGVVRF